MIFLDGVYVDDPHKGLRFVQVKAPSHEELTGLVGTIAQRVGRKLERQGLLERDIAYTISVQKPWTMIRWRNCRGIPSLSELQSVPRRAPGGPQGVHGPDPAGQ